MPDEMGPVDAGSFTPGGSCSETMRMPAWNLIGRPSTCAVSFSPDAGSGGSAMAYEKGPGVGERGEGAGDTKRHSTKQGAEHG